MPRRVKTTTGKAGATSSSRRVLAAVSAVTSAPTSTDQTAGTLLQQNEYVHVLFAVRGTSPVFRVRLYWFHEVSGRWHRGHQVVVSGDDAVLVEAQGAHRLALAVEAVSGTTPELDAWLALARPV